MILTVCVTDDRLLVRLFQYSYTITQIWEIKQPIKKVSISSA